MSGREKATRYTVSKIRYSLLKAALNSDLRFTEIAKRAGISRRRLRKIFLTECDFDLREIAVIANACETDISFCLVERDDWNAQLGFSPSKRYFTGAGVSQP